MTILASDIFTGARALLNDTADEKYHDADLLPLLQIVYSDFLLSLDNNDIPSLDEISAVIPVIANSTTVSPLPSDFKTPIALKERPTGSAQIFNETFQRDWEPEATPTQSIVYWTYREDEIKILPPTTDRDVKLFYVKDLTLSGANSPIPVLYADVVLKYWLGSAAAEFIGENYVRAGKLENRAMEAQQRFLNRRVKGRQAFPIRRPAFRERRKNNYQFR